MSKKNNSTEKSLAEFIAENYLNAPLAILCARYWYRGIVSEVGKDYVTLSHVRAVEVTGPAAANTPQTEDPVPSDLTISTGAVEQICQPLWVWHEMPAGLEVPKEIAAKLEQAEKARRTR